MKKKVLAVLLTVAMAVGVLAGCGSKKAAEGQDGTAAGNGETQVASAGEGNEITLWYYWENEQHQEILNKMVEEYNSMQTASVVKAKYVPFADFKKQLSIGATASELPDMVIIDGPDHASYATMGIFADLTGKIDLSGYYDGPVNSCSLDGKLYGVPFGSNCLGLYYNEDMLTAAGATVPTTWDELRETAKKLTKDNVSGLAFCSLQNEEGTFNFSPWLWSTGATSYDINNEKGIKALDFVSSLVKDGSMSKEAINWTQGDVMNQFISGNVAMMVNGPWQIPTMREQAPDLNWNVTLIPKDAEYASVLGGENFGIIDNENTDASLDFIKFVTSEEKTKSYIDKFGYIAARKDVAETQFADDAQMKKFTEQMTYAQPRGPHASWPEISDAISLAFNEAITESATPAEAAAKAQAAIDSIVK